MMMPTQQTLRYSGLMVSLGPGHTLFKVREMDFFCVITTITFWCQSLIHIIIAWFIAEKEFEGNLIKVSIAQRRAPVGGFGRGGRGGMLFIVDLV